MSITDLLQMVLFVALVVGVTVPLGAYMARVFDGRLAGFGFLERGFYRLSGASLAGLQDKGPHGLSEIIYAYTSATANNGSAFAGFTANLPYTNTMLGVAMLIGRFMVIVPLLAVAGSLAAKKFVPPSAGTFPTHGLLFTGLLIGVILIVGGLTFFPVLVLGPIAEHFGMLAGTTW